jgi:hypothetical protein
MVSCLTSCKFTIAAIVVALSSSQASKAAVITEHTLLFQYIAGTPHVTITPPVSGQPDCGPNLCTVFLPGIHGPVMVTDDFPLEGGSGESFGGAYIGDENGRVIASVGVRGHSGGGFTGLEFVFATGGPPSGPASCADVGGCQLIANGSLQRVGSIVRSVPDMTPISIGATDTDTVFFQAVPEPSTFSLTVPFMLAGLWLTRRTVLRRKGSVAVSES